MLHVNLSKINYTVPRVLKQISLPTPNPDNLVNPLKTLVIVCAGAEGQPKVHLLYIFSFILHKAWNLHLFHASQEVLTDA